MEGAAEAVEELLLNDDKNHGSATTPAESEIKGTDKPTKKDTSVDAKMAGASKEMTPEQKEAAAASVSSIGSMVYSLVKKVALVGGIYLVGYMGWSVAWLIG